MKLNNKFSSSIIIPAKFVAFSRYCGLEFIYYVLYVLVCIYWGYRQPNDLMFLLVTYFVWFFAFYLLNLSVYTTNSIK